MRQGDIWLVEQPNRRSRPAMVVTRTEAIAVLNDVVVAPITSTLRRIPTCVPVGPGDGVAHDSVAVFDQLRCIPKSALTTRLGQLAPGRRHEICSAIAAISDC
jgi:mRNA interferase MazF